MKWETKVFCKIKMALELCPSCTQRAKGSLSPPGAPTHGLLHAWHALHGDFHLREDAIKKSKVNCFRFNGRYLCPSWMTVLLSPSSLLHTDHGLWYVVLYYYGTLCCICGDELKTEKSPSLQNGFSEIPGWAWSLIALEWSQVEASRVE